MPTARELLEQVDALMRRNRTPVVDTDIPELSDAMPEASRKRPMPPVALEDVPELTDAVEEIGIASIADLQHDRGDPSGWLGPDPGDAGAAGPAPDSTAVVPPLSAPAQDTEPTLETRAFVAPVLRETAVVIPEADPRGRAPTSAVRDESPIARLPDVVPRPPSQPAPEPAPQPGPQVAQQPAPLIVDAASMPATPAAAPIDEWARWEALAEEIRMQVLQRIDMFTDNGLREQLNVHLQPIVDRASEELLATIHAQLGELLRSHIAETIEREIEKWRKGTS